MQSPGTTFRLARSVRRYTAMVLLNASPCGGDGAVGGICWVSACLLEPANYDIARTPSAERVRKRGW